MKKTRMNISHSRFILSKLKIFGEIVTTNLKTLPEPQQSELLIKRSIRVARKKGVTFLFYNSIPKL